MRKWTLTGLLAVALICAGVFFAWNVQGFLAEPTHRVAANVLVVEGWLRDAVLKEAATEYCRGGYRYVVAASAVVETPSGEPRTEPPAARAADRLEAYGVPRSRVLVCDPVVDNWNKTHKTAEAVSRELRARGIEVKGVNVLTWGMHARRSHLAYRHAFGPEAPVGVINAAPAGTESGSWWTSRRRIHSVAKNLLGWIREALFG